MLCPHDTKVHAVSMRTAVSPVPVLTEEDAALSLVAATPALVLPATKVHAALMTQMNVQTHPLPARMKACVSTPLALTSEFTATTCEKCCYFEVFLLN